MKLRKRITGQAAVETAITMPLTVFIILGTIQLAMIQHGRMMAEYAAFRAARAGSLNYGDCVAMMDSAVASLMPAYTSAVDPAGSAPETYFASQFVAHKTNGYKYVPGTDSGHNGDILWIVRDSPTVAQVTAGSGGLGQVTEWDNTGVGVLGMRMEIHLIFWFPLKLPFVNWVMGKTFLAALAGVSFTALDDPLNPAATNQTWAAGSPFLQAPIVGHMASEGAAGRYEIPLTASYTMRMMTPPKVVNFAQQNCAPAPQSLQ